ncbi:MAG: hypothetical protein OIF58_07285, partial [Cohaesibacter sp.]|nr:hypothetical protein [Cohaesibacter sp.]
MRTAPSGQNVFEKQRQKVLSAGDRNFEESYDRSEISGFILFYQKYPFGELFSKITFKRPTAFSLFKKLEKFKTRLDALSGPPETSKNHASLPRSYTTM